ncbi:MAG: DMT family transporter [Actinomycetota bacterium]|nr:DMT family transporter [Actinomycetota bacterium]
MNHSVTVIFVVAVGFQLALQAPINNRLGDRVGRLAAALVSNTVGTAILAVLFGVVLAIGDVGGTEGPTALLDVPVWQMAGGLIGAVWVAVSAITIGRIGAGVVASAAITGQLICSLFVDHFGWVGVEQASITSTRLTGACLLVAGTALVARRAPGTGFRADAEDPPGRHLWSLLVVFMTGLMMGFQHPLNGLLSETVGDVTSGLLNFVTGTILLLVAVTLSGRAVRLNRVRGVESRYLLGGLVGVVTVITSLAAVKVVGATALAAALITGQLCGSVALDRLGAFGLERRPLTPRRITGLLLLLAGTVLAVS